jgi:uncharacterized protein involved in exopolysaccharide biosynthesis
VNDRSVSAPSYEQLAALVAAQERMIAQLQARLGEQDARMAAQVARIVEQDARIAELERQLAASSHNEVVPSSVELRWRPVVRQAATTFSSCTAGVAVPAISASSAARNWGRCR